jgi:UDP-GlcNAc:undecaprenyl-phosphate/decaprenyl-phosphate GlcNAc-1-phosphate transferase
MVGLTLLAFVVSALLCAALIRYASGHATRYGMDMPQRFHAGDVPRLGGLAMSLAWALATLRAALSPWLGELGILGLHWSQWLTWLLVLGPMMVGGVSEDITQKLTVRWRLLLSLASALLAVWLLQVQMPRLGWSVLDVMWQSTPWLGIGLALLAVAGLPHAFNIIDGYNGLAGAVALGASLALAYVAYKVGDRQLAGLMLCLVGATLGLLVWNYPRGLIFAGDGGAYFWGGAIALCSLLLVQRHAAVSPWFPMLLLIYPVWETVFSIYRKLARGESPGLADALHFHQLIYRRLVRGLLDENHAREMLRRNNRTSSYLWGFTLLTVVPAVLFWDNTPVLFGFCVLFVVSYVTGYLMIVRFKVPSWVRR